MKKTILSFVVLLLSVLVCYAFSPNERRKITGKQANVISTEVYDAENLMVGPPFTDLICGSVRIPSAKWDQLWSVYAGQGATQLLYGCTEDGRIIISQDGKNIQRPEWVLSTAASILGVNPNRIIVL